MNTLRRFQILSILLVAAVALLTTTSRCVRAEETDASDGAIERESPPQRVTFDQMNALAAGAALRQAEPLRLTSLGAGGLDWTSLGPRPMSGEYWSGGTNVSGRINCVAVDPTNANVAYVAAAQGGVWKTTDGGTTWTALTDGLSSLASGWIAIDPASPSTVWYGTGEQNSCGDCFYGDGLFKSTDGGTSWSKIATVSQVGSYIARVVLEPGDPTTLFVGSSLGFRRSTDSGVTWATTQGGGFCDDIAVDPITPSNVWATINGKGIYRSTDGGATWNLKLAAPERTSITVSKIKPSVLFAALASATGYLQGAYKSSDAGNTWTVLGSTPELFGGQGWYDNTIIASPSDTNIVIAGGSYPYSASQKGVIKTLNGGASWTDITKGLVDGSTVHPDQHCLAYGPDGTLWLGNDGGVWKSTDSGGHWTDLNAGLSITQFYTVAAHPTDPGDIIGGTQDNGSARYRSVATWPNVVSGDGGAVVYQRETPNIFYTSYVRMNPLYKWNNGSYLGTVTGGWGSAADRCDWANAPLVEDPIVGGTFYVGTYRVWKSTDSGTSWNTISPDLTAGTNSSVLRSLAVSPLNPNLMWTGASDGNMRRSRDGGLTWTIIDPGVPGVRLPDIALSPVDTATAYVCADMATGARVQMTHDGGASFTSVTGDLPVGLRAMSMVVDWRVTPERLYIGTDYGVYTSLNGGVNWIKSSSGMPGLAIYDLALDTYNNKLVAASHGRGMWRADVDITGPTLSITSPVGGESWPVGASRAITWSASDPSGVAGVDLQLSLDAGVTYPNVIATGLANTGSYSWTVAPGATSLARVRVVARDGLGQPSNASSPANFHLTTAPTSVDPSRVAFGLDPLTPNPGRAPFAVRFGLPGATAVRLDVFDLGGRHVRTLAAGGFEGGRHALLWDGHDAAGAMAADGVYFVRLRAAGQELVRRVALVH